MDDFENQVRKRNKEWKELERTITELIKEHYRLLGYTAYEPLDNDIARKVAGGDDEFMRNL